MTNQVRLHSINKKNLFIINKSFETTHNITDRTLKVSEGFGLGIDDAKQFHIFKDFNIGINDNDIVFITGDSGSGKSILIDEIIKSFKNKTEYSISNLTDIDIDEDEILVEGVGKDLQQALKILSQVGLNDAFLFLRKYKHLSDGQKYRYKLAKLIFLDSKIWIADEFCSTLDRDTAKIVSYNFQKIARRNNKILIVATTHNDLLYDLNPDVYIDNGYGDTCEIKYNDNIEKKECTLTSFVDIAPGSIEDYEQLSKFHYRDANVCFHKDIFKMTLRNKIVGVIVYTSPKSELHSRNIVFNKEYSRNFPRINKEISCISRVIIHPKYRTIGLGYKLVKETLDKTDSKVVELLSVMTHYNPFAEKAGMIKHNDTEYSILDDFGNSLDLLRKLGFDIDTLSSKNKNLETLNKLSDYDFETLKTKIKVGQRVANHLKNKSNLLKYDREQFAEFLKKWRPFEVDYYYWVNQDWKDDNRQQVLEEDETFETDEDIERAVEVETDEYKPVVQINGQSKLFDDDYYSERANLKLGEIEKDE